MHPANKTPIDQLQTVATTTISAPAPLQPHQATVQPRKSIAESIQEAMRTTLFHRRCSTSASTATQQQQVGVGNVATPADREAAAVAAPQQQQTQPAIRRLSQRQRRAAQRSAAAKAAAATPAADRCQNGSGVNNDELLMNGASGSSNSTDGATEAVLIYSNVTNTAMTLANHKRLYYQNEENHCTSNNGTNANAPIGLLSVGGSVVSSKMPTESSISVMPRASTTTSSATSQHNNSTATTTTTDAINNFHHNSQPPSLHYPSPQQHQNPHFHLQRQHRNQFESNNVAATATPAIELTPLPNAAATAAVVSMRSNQQNLNSSGGNAQPSGKYLQMVAARPEIVLERLPSVLQPQQHFCIDLT